jgi:hypothetical protein
MGGAVSAVTNVAKGAVSAVTAPVQAVVNIAQGKNVADSIGQATVKAVSGAVAGPAELAKGALNATAPVTDMLPGGSTVRQFANTSSKINATGYASRSEGWTFARDGAIIGGAAVAAPAVVGALGTSGTITAAGVGSQALNGRAPNIGQVASLAGGSFDWAPDLGPLTDAYNSSKDYWSLLGSEKPANLGPYPSNSFDFADSSATGLKTASAYDPTLVILGVGAVGAYFLLRRK